MFDLERDPHELRSVYDDPDYGAIRADLEERLAALRRQYRVPDRDPIPYEPSP